MIFKNKFANKVVKYLVQEDVHYKSLCQSNFKTIKSKIRVGDVLLVEGKSNFSKGIKYLTQSVWSHSALYVGDTMGNLGDLFEADIEKGVQVIPLKMYQSYSLRICRPSNLKDYDLNEMLDFLRSKIGLKYDLKNIFDLMKYLIRAPIPDHLKRTYLEFGSKDPSKVVCSSILAEAFKLVNQPILPIEKSYHHSLITPADYDLSPYFEIIK